MRIPALALVALAAMLSVPLGVSPAQIPDSVGGRGFSLPETELWLSKPSLFVPPSPVPDLVRFDLTPELFLTRDLTLPPTFTGGLYEKRADLMSPLLLQWKSEERMRPFRIVLGSLSAGGAAYVAYRHIKKYGLFK